MAEEVRAGPLLRAFQKASPLRCQSSPPASPSRGELLSQPQDSLRCSGGQPALRTGPAHSCAGAGACGRVRSCQLSICQGVAKPLCPCPEGTVVWWGGRGGAGGCESALPGEISSKKLPSWWETAVPQFDLFKEYSV